MDDPETREAYGEYYGAVSLKKGRALSEEILRRNGADLMGQERLSIVDLGTGTGEFIRGLVSGLRDHIPASFDLLLVDRSKGVLEEASRGLGQVENLSLRLAVGTLPGFLSWIEGRTPIDLLTAGNLLAENGADLSGFLTLLRRVHDTLSPGGMMIFAEPADRLSSRALLFLGDELRTACPDLHILAPCPNDRLGSCPALRSPEDWCHEDRPAVFSEETKKTASVLGHIKDALKMTYLILSRTGDPRRLSFSPLIRLVSPLHREKGMAWGLFCDGERIHKLRLLNRNRTGDNRVFWHLKRGESLLAPWAPMDAGFNKGSSPFEDWPKEVPVTGVLRPNGTPWESSEEE